MRLHSLSSLLLTAGFPLRALSSPLQPRQSEAAGYLAAVFKGDVPHVFFNLAPASTPSTFSPVKGGQAVLIPTTGTGGARDPYIMRSNDGSKYYILATDLDISKTDWGAAQTFGSRSIFVWESSDGVNWSTDRLAELMPPTAGYVWAPSAAWDTAKNQYAIFWASRVYAESDTGHTGPADGPYIYYSHTSDFRTFSAPARWDPTDSATYIDQEIQHLGGSSYIRYLGDTAVVKRVVVERSDTGLFGPWTRLGVPVDKIREGPASYRDILNPNRYYLWVDDYGGPGYECYFTETFQVPFAPCQPGVSPGGMRHGAVIQVGQAAYEGLQRL